MDVFLKGDNFCDYPFDFLQTKALLWRVYPKINTFAPLLIWKSCLL